MTELMQKQKRNHNNQIVSPANSGWSIHQTIQNEHPLLDHKNALGNQATQRFAHSCPLTLPSPGICPFGGVCHTCPARVQTKLTINKPGDKYEQEADRLADLVMRMPEPHMRGKATVFKQAQDIPIQRACSTCDEEENLQTKPLAAQITPLVQRQVEPGEEEEELMQTKLAIGAQVQFQDKEPEKEEEEPVQAKLEDDTQIQRQEEEPEEEEKEPIQTKRASSQIPFIKNSLENKIHSLKGEGQPLPTATRSFFEKQFGIDFGQVRIHTGNVAAEAAGALKAHAFTIGRDIMFGAKQYAPCTTKGKKLLAHELTHVVQQEHSCSFRISPLAYKSLLRSPKKVSQINSPSSIKLFSNRNLHDDLSTKEKEVFKESWLRYGHVGIEKLTGDRSHDLDVLARAVFRLRILIDPRARKDPLLGLDPNITRKDPRFLGLMMGPIAKHYDEWDGKLQNGLRKAWIRGKRGGREPREVAIRRLNWLYAKYGILDWPKWYADNIKPAYFLGMKIIGGLHQKAIKALQTAEKSLLQGSQLLFLEFPYGKAFGGGYNARGWSGKLGAHSLGMAFDVQSVFNIEVRGAPGIAWSRTDEGKNHIFIVKLLTGFDVYAFAKRYSQYERDICEKNKISGTQQKEIQKEIQAAYNASKNWKTALDSEMKKIESLGGDIVAWEAYGIKLLKLTRTIPFPPLLKKGLKDPKQIRGSLLGYIKRIQKTGRTKRRFSNIPLPKRGFFNIPIEVVGAFIDQSRPANLRFHWVPFHHFQLANWIDELKTEGVCFPSKR